MSPGGKLKIEADAAFVIHRRPGQRHVELGVRRRVIERQRLTLVFRNLQRCGRDLSGWGRRRSTICWSEYGKTLCWMKSAALSLPSRKYDENDPAGVFVPDFVIALI